MSQPYGDHLRSSDAADTSDRLYTPEELAAYAAGQAAVQPTPVDPLADPLSDPLGRPDEPAGQAPPYPAAGAPAGPRPTAPPAGWTPGPPAPQAGPQVTAHEEEPPAARPAPSHLAQVPPVAAESAPGLAPALSPAVTSAPVAGVEPSSAPGAGAAQPAAAQATPQSATESASESASEPAGEMRRFMSATDFLDRRADEQEIGPASWGWRGAVRRWSGGLIKPRMGAEELAHEMDRRAIQRDFDGPRTIAFVNPKGGAAKTTGVLAAGYTFGTVRGGGVVAWDNNETRGTLGIRGVRSTHRNTTRELLEDLGRFNDVYQSRIGDLGAFVRSQGDAHFDVLASDERPDVTGQIHADDFSAVHKLLERFYRIIVVDTGNNLRAENWLAAAEAADLLVVTSTVREDTGYSGLWMLDALQDAGYANLKHKTLTVLSDPSPQVDEKLAADLVEVYEQRTRGVFRVPYDAALVSGSVINYHQLSTATRMSWVRACAAMAEAL